MKLVIHGERQFGIKECPSRASWGSLLLKIETKSRVKDILGIYGSSGISYGGLSRGGCEAYLVTLTDRCSFLCFSGQRGTIAKSMYYQEHLCVVALTSIERGTQFFPLASYFLV